MGPSPAARRFEARLRLYIALRRAIRGIDASDVLTVAGLALLGAGLLMVAVPLAFIALGTLLVAMTPVGAALRLLIRGR